MQICDIIVNLQRWKKNKGCRDSFHITVKSKCKHTNAIGTITRNNHLGEFPSILTEPNIQVINIMWCICWSDGFHNIYFISLPPPCVVLQALPDPVQNKTPARGLIPSWSPCIVLISGENGAELCDNTRHVYQEQHATIVDVMVNYWNMGDLPQRTCHWFILWAWVCRAECFNSAIYRQCLLFIILLLHISLWITHMHKLLYTSITMTTTATSGASLYYLHYMEVGFSSNIICGCM